MIKLRERRTREALRMADSLLDDLEELQMGGDARVPIRLWPLVEGLRQGASQLGISSKRGQLRVQEGIITLMDDIFELEGKILRRLRPYSRTAAYGR